jgi:hypothetical protein
MNLFLSTAIVPILGGITLDLRFSKKSITGLFPVQSPIVRF